MGEDWPFVTPPPGGRDQLSDLMAERLLAQRAVLLHGLLDDHLTVARVSAAELMTLDAEGDEPVTLRVDCGEAEAGPCADPHGRGRALMGVPVRALCLGQVGRRRRGCGGGVRGPGRHAEHPLRLARADYRPVARLHDASSSNVAPVGRTPGPKSGGAAFSAIVGGGGGRSGQPSRCASTWSVASSSARKPSSQGGVRADRRGLPPRCGHTPVARFGAAADGVPTRALSLAARSPGPAYDAVMAPAATPRIEPLPREDWDDVLTRVLEGSSGGTQEPMHIFTTLARAPGELFRRWLGFGGAPPGWDSAGSPARAGRLAHGLPLRRALRVGPAHLAGRARWRVAPGGDCARR